MVLVAVLDHKRIIWFVMQWRWVVVALLHTVRVVESNIILGGFEFPGGQVKDTILIWETPF